MEREEEEARNNREAVKEGDTSIGMGNKGLSGWTEMTNYLRNPYGTSEQSREETTLTSTYFPCTSD